jgi:hypothetical protein
VGQSARAEALPMLDLELAEVMVEVLVRQGGPFYWGEGAEEEVGMAGADGGAAGYEAVDGFAEAPAFEGEIAFIGYEAGLIGCGVAAHGLALYQQGLFGQRAEQASEEDARRGSGLAHRQVQGGGAVGQSLGGIHGAPLARAIGPQAGQALPYFVRPC